MNSLSRHLSLNVATSGHMLTSSIPFAAMASIWFGSFGLLLIVDRAWPSNAAGEVAFILSFSVLCLCVVVTVSFIAKSIGNARADFSYVVGACVLLFLGIFLPIETIGFAPLFGFALLTSAAIIGGYLGRQIQEPQHFWPLISVALAFDCWSVFSTSGFTQNVVLEQAREAQSSLFLMAMPIPGMGLTHMLGVGDVVFSAFLLSAIVRLRLEFRQAVWALAAGFAACLGCLMVFHVPTPALIFIGPAMGISLGRSIKPRPKEMLMAVCFVLFGYLSLIILPALAGK
jgi:hypothetical protein